ncbi:GntR family transcriptional regulator [Occallatibacter riparius]|uniref:GntR family transcriptional regulator n=1 Tax=Occallatibacter riparius TaxID=1002689 RepID=A0A9J7BLS0_9BACT|nr:GntR family transcriptional regulator [Occallatibacter riparius]UWZ83696.1 GntR family transcriptional regulator [Occallatibacter riparius]
MAQVRKNGLPAYKQIQSTIMRRVEKGSLKPGDLVDSERELARIHGVSLMTARHALIALEREGMVVRRRGSGTFVAPPKIHFNKLMSYTEQMSGRGLAVSSKVLSLSITHTEQEIAARLALPATSPLVKLERLRLSGDEPCAIETCYFSADEFAGITKARLDRLSLFSILERDYGIQIAHADEEIDATTADAHTARLLDISSGAAVLRIRQKIYSTSGKPGLYVLGLYRSDRHSLFIRRFR